MPTIGSSTRPRTSRTWLSAIARTAGPDTPPVPPPSQGWPVRSGCMAIPRRVLMRLTASAPCCSAAAATSAGDAQLGVSLTINGFSEIGRTTSSSAGELARVGAHDQPGLDVRARDVELDRRDLVALGEGGDEAGDVLARGAHDVDDQRHGQLGELRQVLLEVAVEALVGQPDRVDHAAGQLPQPRRRVALARLERDGLGDEGGERELLVEGVAEGAACRDGVERPGAVDDPVRERDAAELDHSSSRSMTGPSTQRRT